MVRVDHNTLLRKKGKFARVCLNIDIPKTLPGTLRIHTPIHDLFIPIIYEGLHEERALFRCNTHSLNECPSIPAILEIEVMVEKFQSHGI